MIKTIIAFTFVSLFAVVATATPKSAFLRSDVRKSHQALAVSARKILAGQRKLGTRVLNPKNIANIAKNAAKKAQKAFTFRAMMQRGRRLSTTYGSFTCASATAVILGVDECNPGSIENAPVAFPINTCHVLDSSLSKKATISGSTILLSFYDNAYCAGEAATVTLTDGECHEGGEVIAKVYTGDLVFVEHEATRSDCSDAEQVTWGVIPRKCLPGETESFKLSCSSNSVSENRYTDTSCSKFEKTTDYDQGACHVIDEEEEDAVSSEEDAVSSECDDNYENPGYSKWTCKENARGIQMETGCSTGSVEKGSFVFKIDTCLTHDSWDFAIKFSVSGSAITMDVWEGYRCSGSPDGSATVIDGECKDDEKRSIYKGEVIDVEWKGTIDCSDTEPYIGMYVPGSCTTDPCEKTSARMRCSSDHKTITEDVYNDEVCSDKSETIKHGNGVCFDEHGVSSALAMKPLLASAIFIAVPLLFG